MAINGYLDIDDIGGESKRAHHEDEIDVHDVFWSVKNSGASKSGRKRSRAKVSPLVVRKFTDASSPYLALACLQGKSIDEVVLSVEQGGNVGGTGGGHLDYLVITMTNVRFSKFEVLGVGAGDNERIEEELGLVFENVEVRYTVQADDNSAGAEHEISYDVAAGV